MKNSVITLLEQAKRKMSGYAALLNYRFQNLSVKAEAEAEANQKIAASLTDSLIKWQQANNWDGKLPTYMAGESSASLPILNLGGTQQGE